MSQKLLDRKHMVNGKCSIGTYFIRKNILFESISSKSTDGVYHTSIFV